MVFMKLTQSLIFVLQQLPPIVQSTPEPTQAKVIIDAIGSIATPVAAIGLIVAIIYFFWHSKNREELTKALAEASALADTRGKKIQDQKDELSDQKLKHTAELAAQELKHTAELAAKELEISSKELEISTKSALVLAKVKIIEEMELEDEARAKTEFRLRAEIMELENKLGIDQHTTGNQ
jgi:hypothetical protein